MLRCLQLEKVCGRMIVRESFSNVNFIFANGKLRNINLSTDTAKLNFYNSNVSTGDTEVSIGNSNVNIDAAKVNFINIDD
jgi:hypothetical protein